MPLGADESEAGDVPGGAVPVLTVYDVFTDGNGYGAELMLAVDDENEDDTLPDVVPEDGEGVEETIALSLVEDDGDTDELEDVSTVPVPGKLVVLLYGDGPLEDTEDDVEVTSGPVAVLLVEGGAVAELEPVPGRELL